MINPEDTTERRADSVAPPSCHVALILGPEDVSPAGRSSNEEIGRLGQLVVAAETEGLSHLSLLFEDNQTLTIDIEKLIEHIETYEINSDANIEVRAGPTSVDNSGQQFETASGLVFSILAPHDAKTDFVEAVKKAANQKLTDEAALTQIIQQNLRFGQLPDPDLVVYFGGRRTLSKLGVWVAAYSEFAFLAEPWHSFTATGLTELLTEFGLRERRFGAVGH